MPAVPRWLPLPVLLAGLLLAAALPPAALAGVGPAPEGPAPAYTPRGPISIGPGANFAAIAASQGWPGNGTKANPFVIAGYEISTAGSFGNAIYIASQTAWVVIRDNHIHDVPGGIRLQYGVNAIVTNNVIERLTGTYQAGVDSSYSGEVRVTDNVIRVGTSDAGVVVWDQGPSTVSGNTISGGRFGVRAWSNDQVVAGNTISGSALFGIWDFGGTSAITGNTIATSGRDCIASHSYRGSLLRNTLSGCAETGLRAYGGFGHVGLTIGDNVVAASPVAIRVDDVRGVLVEGNEARAAGATGILLTGSRPVAVVGNAIENHTTGILAQGGREHRIAGNAVKGGADGLLLQGSVLNTVTENRVTGSQRGITLNASEGNVVFDNLFANQRNAVVIGSPDNAWSIPRTPGTNIVGGSFLGGNAWSDYTGVDADGDGLGEVPYGPLPSGSLPGLPPRVPPWAPLPPGAPAPPNPPALPGALPQPEAVASQLIAYGPYDRHPLMTGPVAVSPPEVTRLAPPV